MFKRFFLCLCCTLLSVPCSLTLAQARDFIRGPLIVSLSDKWTVVEEPGPELLKATLTSAPTATLSVWKYKPGSLSADQFLNGLRSDLGWTAVSAEAVLDPRFGRTGVGLYKKLGAYDELPFKIRSYDFVLDGDIYVLIMSSPESVFDVPDAEFRAVFAGLANMSGAPGKFGRSAGEALEKSGEVGRSKGEEPEKKALVSQPALAFPRSSPGPSQPSPDFSRLLPTSPTFTFYYELPDGRRLGFDAAKKEASVLDATGAVKSVFPVSGTPYISANGIFALSDEYAYRIDPSTGNVVARLPVGEILSGGPGYVPMFQSPPAVSQPSPDFSRPSPNLLQTSPGDGDPVKSALQQAAAVRRLKGVRPAIDYLTGQRPVVEKTGSPHIYEFYFRMGEYWEETGDLETALAFYRLATKAID